MEAWHVATLIAGRERRVAEAILDDACASSVLWPRWLYRSRDRRGRPVESERSLAPGYLFVRFAGDDPRAWHAIRDSGVSSFIGGEFPTIVRDDAIEELMTAVIDASDRIVGVMRAPVEDAFVARFRAGDNVRLFTGKMAGAIGVVSWTSRKHVRIVTSMFGRQTEMSMTHAEAELVVEKVHSRRSYENDRTLKQFGWKKTHEKIVLRG